MKHYTSAAAAISDMHERGFTSDFQLFGNDLLWVQEKKFIRAGDFAIIECHHFWNPASYQFDLVLYGIIATHYNMRGILFQNGTSQAGVQPPVIVKKVNELREKVLYRSNIENEEL